MDLSLDTAGQRSLMTHDSPGQRLDIQGSSPVDRSNITRTLPPLQVSKTTSAAAGNRSYSNPSSPKSPTEVRTTSDSHYSPRSPRSNLAANLDQPMPPPERAGELPTSRDASVNGNRSRTDALSIRQAAVSPFKAQSYSQLRNVSSPFPEANSLGRSSPSSPRSTASPPPPSTGVPPVARPMPRTSSIDSAISTISSGTLHSNRPSQDSMPTSIPDISHLIQTAGSPEAVIQHLLKEKQHSAAQNAQLWTLVDKQRTLVLGLNQDLERALKDKEKYRKKLKERLDSIPPVPIPPQRAAATQRRSASPSPAASEGSTELSIQRQSLERNVPPHSRGTAPPIVPVEHSAEGEDASLPGNASIIRNEPEDNWVRSKTKPMGPKHAHKATSSSDVGVFGPSRMAPSVAPIRTDNLDPSRQKDGLETPSQSSPSSKPVVSPSTSFTAKRSQPFSTKPFNGPALALIESTPPGNDIERMTPPRKAPPAPLDLGQPTRDTPAENQFGPDDHSGSDYDEAMEVDELPALDRGRKKTREDDDREREAALLKEKEDRSRSQKEKSSKSRTGSSKSKSQDHGTVLQPHNVPIPSTIKALSPDLTPAGAPGFLSPPTSLAGVLSPTDSRSDLGTTERIMSMKPMSPGLPLSPRPNHRPMNPPTPRLPRDAAGPSATSPPLSPRGGGFVGLPLTPRAPRQPIPLPPNTPISLASPKPSDMDLHKEGIGVAEEPPSPMKSPTSHSQMQSDRSVPSRSSELSQPGAVFRGFMYDTYPDLLLPPNALPSILVKVVSSRLKPSRHSLVIKGCDEEPVFTLGVSARSDRQELWQVEKPIQSLQQLDHQLRQSSVINIKQPDRSLFSGHAPAKIDARRMALESYFEALLDTPMDERTALTLCNYLSSQVSEPINEDMNGIAAAPHSGSPTAQGADGRLLKEGYLTKRGKNFGGWKARFFALDEPVLRYYETPGGSLLGTIKLHSAQIGKQNKSSSHSPSRGEEGDGLYRHAFLIREPKRKDSNAYIDHVLCAESDAERDSWVAALLCYVEVPEAEMSSRPILSRGEGSHKVAIPAKKNSVKKDAVFADSPDSETFESLQAVPYENTQAAQAPLVQITPDSHSAESPSPTTSGSQPSVRAPSAQSKAISGPQNGAKISDVGAWGNKPMAPTLNHPKEQKKRSIWGFRDKNGPELGGNHSNDSNLSLTQQQYQEQITNVKAAFGIPLAEAVEYCGPRGIDACLPAVVYRCLEYLEIKDAASEEGIFRMSGSNTLIKGLRGRFNAEGDFDFLGEEEPYYDVHAVASLLKLYLRELPQPVLTRELHLQFLSVLEIQDRPSKIGAYNALMHKLPKPNFTLLRALSAFLITIVNNSDVNKMSIRNVGIVFSPTLNIPAPVFAMFLTEFEAVFGDAPDDCSMPALDMTSNEPLTPEDIRSPRRQMFSDIPTPSYTQDTFSSKPHQLTNHRGPKTTYEQGMQNPRTDNDTGFVPLQPTYNNTAQQLDSVTVAGPEYAVARPRNLAPGGDAKAGRRESSMLLSGVGQRKGSLPMMRNNADMPHDEPTFG